MNRRTIYVWMVAIICFLVLMIVTPSIPQSQDYHHFADTRSFLGIPNTLNVVSNFPFLVIGLIGLVLCHYNNYFKLSLQGELYGWTCFYIGVAAVAIGSSYYHLHPNDTTLVWDRLPMTVAFTSIVSIFIIERIDQRKGTLSIVPLLLVGIISILYWCLFDDLRPYALVQFVPCIAIPVMTILLPPMYTHSTYWLWAAGFYLLAKVEEATDKLIYTWTFHIVSGHTLKHLFAAMVPVFLTLMLAKRTIEPERQSLFKIWKVTWMKVKDNKTQTRQALTPEQINGVCYVDINSNKAVFDSLRNNPKVHYDGKRFSYKSKHDLKDKTQLLHLIRKFPEGIAVIDLKDSYPNVMEDLQGLKGSGQVWLLSNFDSQEDIAFPNDPRINIKVDDDLKQVFRGIELPRDMLDVEKDLQKNGMKPATNTAKRRANAEHVTSAKPKPKKKNKEISKRTKLTNAHLPELFRN